MALAHSVHFEEMVARTPIWQAVFLGSVALLWLIVAKQIEAQLTKTAPVRHRLVAAGIATAMTVALVTTGIAAWEQQVSLAVGCTVWSAVLMLVYGSDLARLLGSCIEAV